MKTKLLTVALVLLAVLTLTGFTYRTPGAAKWEYQIVTFTVNPDDRVDSKKINSDGEQGWELIAVERDGTRRTYIFKRPL